MGRGAWWTTVYGVPNSRTEQQSLSELLYNIALVSCSLFLFDSAILAGGKWNPRVSGIPFNDKGTRWGCGALPRTPCPACGELLILISYHSRLVPQTKGTPSLRKMKDEKENS